MSCSRLRHILLLVLSWLATIPPGFAGEAAFRVGVGRQDITPKEPVPMWGYGARRDALSEGMLDPLYATVLVVQAGARKLAIVSLDLGRSPVERSLVNIRARLRAEAAIEHSFIAGSHTHHGPVLELSDTAGRGRGKFDAALRYYQQLEEGIVAAALEANARLVPAKLAVGSVLLEKLNRNRHTKIEPKAVDRELAVLRLDDTTDRPIALVVNWAAHPTMLPASTLKFSADYIGPLRATVESELGASVVFMQGAAGDISTQPGDRKSHEAYGRALGQEVLNLASSLRTRPVAVPSLLVREDRFRFGSRTDLSNPVVRAAYELAFFPELVANYVDDYAEGVRPRLTVALLNGEVAFVGASGEFFCAHALRLKERARMRPVFFFGYCNGYHQYFPTIEAAAEGGYGADPQVAPAAVGAGEQLMNTALIWLYEMLGKLQ